MIVTKQFLSSVGSEQFSYKEKVVGSSPTGTTIIINIMKNKYGATKTTVDGIKFDSRKESQRYIQLKELESKGEISNLQLQVKYELIPKQTNEKGKCIERACYYVADFVYNKNNETIVEDTKSPATRTREYIIKRKLMLYVHGIHINEL